MLRTGYAPVMPGPHTPPTHADFGLTVVSDIGCPWAHIGVYRVEREIRARGLDVELPLDHRAFPLELIHSRPTPAASIDRIVELGLRVEPEAGWSQPGDPWTYPVTTMPALEAVQAAKAQGPQLSADLDRVLRRAMFAEWRCISVFPVVLEVAERVAGLDVAQLDEEIRTGRARSELWNDVDQLASAVPGSPSFVLPDGSVVFSPGLEVEWRGDEPLVVRDDPSAVAELVTRAMSMQRAD